MDTALTKAHGAGYLFLIGFLFILSTLMTPGCGIIPQTQLVADQAYEFEDGTSVEKGEPVYMDANKNATANATDPETGVPNAPFMVTDVAKLEKAKEAGEKAAGGLPPPFGVLLAFGIGIVGAGSIAAARKLDARKLAKAGAKPKPPGEPSPPETPEPGQPPTTA